MVINQIEWSQTEAFFDLVKKINLAYDRGERSLATLSLPDPMQQRFRSS